MTREEAVSIGLEEIDRHKCIIAELPTGYGKTALSIKMANKVCEKVWKNEKESTSILILVAKRAHKNNWLKEINTWGGLKTDYVVIECYESLKKYKDGFFDVVICDEAQHLSDARKDILKSITIRYNLICLSATLPKSIKEWLGFSYSTTIIKSSMQDAIDTEVLPDPTIYKIPLNFDGSVTECIYKNVGKKLPVIECNWKERWQYIKRKDVEVHIYCTKRQYLDDLNSQIDWYKSKAMRGAPWAKTKWLKLCGDRLKWLAMCKNALILSLLDKLKNYRTLTFCASIEQSEILGRNCIHSKNKLSLGILDKFNERKIKHITSCNILNEGLNLTDCRVGIFANINASDIMVIQRIGRLLRHKEPVIIIPYYKNTREEELVNKHLEGYNPELIKCVNNINDIMI